MLGQYVYMEMETSGSNRGVKIYMWRNIDCTPYNARERDDALEPGALASLERGGLKAPPVGLGSAEIAKTWLEKSATRY